MHNISMFIIKKGRYQKPKIMSISIDYIKNYIKVAARSGTICSYGLLR